MVSTGGTAGSIRAANRERITEAILQAARAQLAERGASAISLRAIARQLGMSSSAVYRYFPSRDELLTVLIIDAYDSLGAFVERAEKKVPRSDIAGRFRAICRAVRSWALDNEHEYFLIYGSPVPGYKAPTDTIAPATRVATLLLTLLAEAAGGSAATRLEDEVRGAAESPSKDVTADSPTALERQLSVTGRPVRDPLPAAVVAAVAPMRARLSAAISDAQVVAALNMFSGLFGTISFELSGQLHNVVKEGKAARSAYFDALIDSWLSQVGLEQ
ncbi:MAG: WHG domain-containing protein [Candidatus Nanopelagicales bacterium]|nr:WHG domain-containing protein [Candidatus Nanopelagicales bacterium]